MRLSSRRGLVWLVPVLLFVSAPAARAQFVYHDTAVAIPGDPAPGTIIGTYGSVDTLSINASGDVAFAATVNTASVTHGIFLDSGGTDNVVVLPGGVAPGTGGGFYSGVGQPSLNSAGDVAFFAIVSGGTTLNGIFLDSGGVETAVVLVDDSAPVGTFTGFDRPVLNEAGDIFFGAGWQTGVSSDGYAIYRYSGGVVTELVPVGAAAPGTGGGTFGVLENYSVNDAGDVSFWAEVEVGPSVTEGIFRYSGGVVSAVAVFGDTAPGGGTYVGFGSQRTTINGAGEVTFFAEIEDGTHGGGIFKDTAGTDTLVAVPSDPAPGTGGGSYGGFRNDPGAQNTVGTAVFMAHVTGSGTGVTAGLFLQSGGDDTAVALNLDPAPGTGGGVYSFSFLPNSPRVSLSSNGHIAFTADISGGTQGTGLPGLFRASRGAGSVAYDEVAIALPGDLAPGTGVGTYGSFGTRPDLSDTGDVSFRGVVPGFGEGVFVDLGGVHIDIALDGQLAPGSAGGAYTFFGDPSISASGDVAFSAITTVGSNGNFVDSLGVDSVVARNNDATPIGGVYTAMNEPSINTSSDVLFRANISVAPGEGFFVNSGGTVTARETGGAAPGGGSYTGFGGNHERGAINASGDIAFRATTTGIGGGGIFVDSAGVDSVVAYDNDPAPGTAGSYLGVGEGAINDAGDVAFHAAVSTGGEGTFVDEAGVDRDVALTGDTAPGTAGATFSSFAEPHINSAGHVAYYAAIPGIGEGLFVEVNGVDFAVALTGETAPGTGGTYASFGTMPRINAFGQVAYYATVADGTLTEGIFLATPTTPACSDGVDNDLDGLIDFPADPGCFAAGSLVENPHCDDDLDNDGDGKIDWDGGIGGGTPDEGCVGLGYRKREYTLYEVCGLGFELVLAVPLLAAARLRWRARSRRGQLG